MILPLGPVKLTNLKKRNEMTTLVLAYANYSKGAKALARALGVKVYTPESLGRDFPSAFGKKDTIINWGNAFKKNAYLTECRIINPLAAVAACSNKITFFKGQQQAKDGARIPTFTTNLEEALGWVTEKIPTMGRDSRGSCGTDIVFSDEDLQRFTSSDFWVQYKKKKEEFRVHLVAGAVVAVQKKSLRKTDPDTGSEIDTKNVDFRVRNLRNGFVFQRHDIAVPGDVVEQAKLAMTASGLDFGAVDVIWNEHEGNAYVLEINTAPGLEGTTITDYATPIKKLLAA
jgi:glutathione synthase/RimK-type ligase-like ATP-grasp enzyme